MKPDRRVGQVEIFHIRDVQGLDATIVKFREPVVWVSLRDKMMMDVDFVVRGRKVVEPQRVHFHFTLFTAERRVSDKQPLEIDINNQVNPIDLLPTYQGQRIENLKGGLGIDGVTYSLPYSSFVKLAEAESIRMRMGGIIFDMAENVIKALKDMRISIEP